MENFLGLWKRLFYFPWDNNFVDKVSIHSYVGVVKSTYYIPSNDEDGYRIANYRQKPCFLMTPPKINGYSLAISISK